MKVVFEVSGNFPAGGLSKEEWEERILQAVHKVRNRLGYANKHLTYFSVSLSVYNPAPHPARFSFNVKWLRPEVPWTTAPEGEAKDCGIDLPTIEASETMAKVILRSMLKEMRREAEDVFEKSFEFMKSLPQETK